jgi:DNA repair protein RadC
MSSSVSTTAVCAACAAGTVRSSAVSSAVSFASNALMVCDARGSYRPATGDEVLRQARCVMSRRVRRGVSFCSPSVMRDYLLLQLGHLEHEVFCVAFLDAQHRLLEFREMFKGSLTQTSVYPREVVKAALACNAAAVVLSHNHPSGQAEPSRADEFLTQALKSALQLVDVRVLDHIVVGADSSVSFAERGLI